MTYLDFGERRQRKSREAQEGIKINKYIIFSYRYQVSCMFPSLVFACMALAFGFLIVVCHWHGDILD